MQFWCSAQGIPWSWTWRPYVGVWLLVILLAWAYRRWLWRPDAGALVESPSARRWRARSAAGGILLLWIALDWPVGTLGAGYLASVHMVQFLLIAMLAPLLLLYGIPDAAMQRLARRPRLLRSVRLATHPLVGIAAFNTMLAVTHMPSVVDTLMLTQLGSFALDLVWLGVGLLFWWPIVCPVPERPHFTGLVKIGYLVLGTLAHVYVSMYLLTSSFPVYAIYELAPRVAWISASADQEVAGGVMLLGGSAVMFTAMTVIFFRWGREVEAAERQGSDQAPTQPVLD